jgi:hypothetical protein
MMAARTAELPFLDGLPASIARGVDRAEFARLPTLAEAHRRELEKELEAIVVPYCAMRPKREKSMLCSRLRPKLLGQRGLARLKRSEQALKVVLVAYEHPSAGSAARRKHATA